ncbi:ABC transporter substrate-binding protein [Lacihabitans soyangensis]|uniref:Thiamine pyrimidine synthase n=1 Tax=Lacihabitans soyangensis TaxID=869394 RepID=A0AAE3H1I8_9BACT|nr:ABC transporter substrate-binding protein [Lacihabitans soyangensis]MCP9762314.1 hypothetical protein [Lacihabitans soyangensis]
MKKVAILIISVFYLLSCSEKESNKINLRLKWVKQAQFAGYLVAESKGFYKDAGLDVTILPAGPDIKSFMTVANGSDQIGIAMPNQIISARSNGVPLTIIGQIMQDSPYRYVIKSENNIKNLTDLKGKSVGLWLKNDEAEFIAMLKSAGMSLNDVKIVPQEFTIVPFLENKYEVSQVTVFNELNQIRDKGYTEDKLQILSPKDYNSAFIGDMIFANQDFIDKNPELIKKFLSASLKGWKYALAHKEETIKILLKANKDLDKIQQMDQLLAVEGLINSGKNLSEGFGYMDEATYSNIQKILKETGQIQNEVDIKKIYTDRFWKELNSEEKQLK